MGDLARVLPESTRKLIEGLAHRAPSLGDLTEEQSRQVAAAVLGDFLKDEMKRAVLSERVRFPVERDLFLSDKRSVHTRRAYATALGVFEGWLRHKNLNVVDLTPALADDFIRAQRSLDLDEDTIRLRITTLSSFYTFLERRYEEVRNPFRGTKIRPRSSWATAVIPSEDEVKILMDKATPEIRVAIAIMVETGMRVGGLVELRIKADGSFLTVTKGKRFESLESLSQETLQMIREAGMSTFRPWNAEDHPTRGDGGDPVAKATAALSSRIGRHCAALKDSKLVAAAYSPHDFRHYFAQKHADRGLVWLRDRLGHASIAVTERYLRNTLGVDTVQF